MGSLRSMGDRRSHVRLEVVGALWGTLQAVKPTRVLDLSPTGALIASPTPLPPDTIQSVRLTVEGEDLTIEARVRHVREVSNPPQPPVYHVGLEFLSRLTIG